MPTWTAIVPVKGPTAEGKTRLGEHPARTELALAFAIDTLEAIRRSTVDRVLVVCTDPAPPALAADLSIELVLDDGTGLNGALQAAAQQCTGAVLMAVADLPCLRAADVDAFCAFALEHGPAFVADTSGTGTTMLAGSPAPTPMFGERSRARHAAAGYTPFEGATATARRDVDTAVDLWDAVRLGVGDATARILQ